MYLHEIQRWKQLGHKLMYVDSGLQLVLWRLYLLTKLEVTEGIVSVVMGTRLLESQPVYILCWCEARDFQQLAFCLLDT